MKVIYLIQTTAEAYRDVKDFDPVRASLQHAAGAPRFYGEIGRSVPFLADDNTQMMSVAFDCDPSLFAPYIDALFSAGHDYHVKRVEKPDYQVISTEDLVICRAGGLAVGDEVFIVQRGFDARDKRPLVRRAKVAIQFYENAFLVKPSIGHSETFALNRSDDSFVPALMRANNRVTLHPTRHSDSYLAKRGL